MYGEDLLIERFVQSKSDSHYEKVYLKHVCNTRTHVNGRAACNQSPSVNQLIGLEKSGTWIEAPVEGSL